MDSVLAQRGGLPITMAILHRAVGRRAGLGIELVNMPGHVINRVQVTPGSGGGSSSGAGANTQSVYVDVFYGKVLDEAGLRCVPLVALRLLFACACHFRSYPTTTKLAQYWVATCLVSTLLWGAGLTWFAAGTNHGATCRYSAAAPSPVV